MSEVILSKEQEENILNEWNSREKDPPSLLELIHIAYPDDPNLDGRTKEGKAVKKFLATRELKARGAHEYQRKEKLKLTNEDEEFVKNYLSSMSSNEIARVVFKNETLMPLSQETRTINEYIKTLESENDEIETYENTSNIPIDDFKPPSTFHLAINRINKYVLNGINKEKISAKQKKDVQALIGYMATYRFVHLINRFDSVINRELYESSFVRYTYDKNDLAQEEVDQYIILSSEVVISATIQRRVERLNRLLDDVSNDTEGRRISMALVESINTAQGEYHQSVNRQHKLLDDLKEKRSNRLKNQLKDNASILNLVEAWKSEEQRVQMIELADRRKGDLKDEIESLKSIDDVKARIMGITEEEVLD